MFLSNDRVQSDFALHNIEEKDIPMSSLSFAENRTRNIRPTATIVYQSICFSKKYEAHYNTPIIMIEREQYIL
jgi:hypothetical protein